MADSRTKNIAISAFSEKIKNIFPKNTRILIHNWSWMRQFHRDFRRQTVDNDDSFFMGNEL